MLVLPGGEGEQVSVGAVRKRTGARQGGSVRQHLNVAHWLRLDSVFLCTVFRLHTLCAGLFTATGYFMCCVLCCAVLQVLGLGWCGLQDAGAITLGAVLKTNQVGGAGTCTKEYLTGCPSATNMLGLKMISCWALT